MSWHDPPDDTYTTNIIISAPVPLCGEKISFIHHSEVNYQLQVIDIIVRLQATVTSPRTRDARDQKSL